MSEVEVVNRAITPMLAKLTDDPDKWDELLHKVEFAVNNTLHKSTGQTPCRSYYSVRLLIR